MSRSFRVGQLRLLSLSRLLISTIPAAPIHAFSIRPFLQSRALHSASMSSNTCETDGLGRVAVIGAGIAGSSLASALHKAGAKVTVFEMGRGAGGRMATRMTRDLPGLSVNHGVPVFTASNPVFLDVVADLLRNGVAVEWKGTYVELDADTHKFEALQLPGKGFVGAPDMSSICEYLLRGVETKFQAQVAEVIADSNGVWKLLGPKKEDLGKYDWLCVTSHTMGHSRWESIFGTAPPLKAAAGAELAPLIDPLEAVHSSPVMIAMVAFKSNSPAAAAITRLPFSLADVKNHEKIRRIVRQESEGYVSLVVHSTHEFASAHSNVYGSTSAAAKLAPDRWTPEQAKKREADVLQDLYSAATGLLGPMVGSLEEPAWGPLLHRWGSAFCGPSTLPIPAVSHARRFGLCGDFLAHTRPETYSGVEAAAVSGLELARSITSSRASKI